MYPLTVIRIAKGYSIDVELKNGDTYNGVLQKCDLWMNLHLKNVRKNETEVIKESYIKGISIKRVQFEKKHLSMQETLQRRKQKERAAEESRQEKA
ncbi:U6 snRNA-associated Sm-like protein LSm4 [Nematocida sp. AWRm80]|nr:U6 snRNA-associated Sm-like protein LSm4 [Nematocida sp. AWRm80]